MIHINSFLNVVFVISIWFRCRTKEMFAKVLFEYSKYFWWHYHQTSSNIFRNSFPLSVLFGFFACCTFLIFYSSLICLHTFEIMFITKSTNDLLLQMYKWQSFTPFKKSAQYQTLHFARSWIHLSWFFCWLKPLPGLCSPNLHSLEVNARMPGGERITAQDKEETLYWK